MEISQLWAKVLGRSIRVQVHILFCLLQHPQDCSLQLAPGPQASKSCSSSHTTGGSQASAHVVDPLPPEPQQGAQQDLGTLWHQDIEGDLLPPHPGQDPWYPRSCSAVGVPAMSSQHQEHTVQAGFQS